VNPKERDARDKRMWNSLDKKQREWVTQLLTADQLAVEVRESLACAFAFDLGQRGDPDRRLVLLS